MESKRRDGHEPPHAPEAAVHEEIVRLQRELHPLAHRLPPVGPRSRLDRDLGLDSLARMELLARLEDRFRAAIPEKAGLAAQTPADLVEALAGAAPRAATADTSLHAFAHDAALDLPDLAATLVDVLRWRARRQPDRVHVRFEGGDADGVELTHAALYEDALRVAAGLRALGVEAGEPVALMLPTHPDFLAAFFGAMLAGGVPAPLYPPLRPSGLADYWQRQAGILANCGARVLVLDRVLAAHRQRLRPLLGAVRHLPCVPELAAAGGEPPPFVANGDALAMLQYTSGSTAAPKGVMLSHANLLASIRIMGRLAEAGPEDGFVSWLPLYHDMGLIGAWLGTLYHGVPLVLMPPQSFLLRPERWLWAIHRYRATLSAAPNFAYELCVKRIGDDALAGLDLSCWRLAFCGAEPVLPETMTRFAARFARHGFRPEALYPVYGLAENTLGLTFPPPGRGVRVLRVARDAFLARGEARPPDSGDGAGLEFVSCGLPLPGHGLRIVGADGHELPDGRQGRIEFQGPCACLGYYRNPAANAALRHGDWLDTGDLGLVHDGELYVTGRAKDVVIRAGRNIHPQGIEQAVGALHGVRAGRVAVFGTPLRGTGTEGLVVVAETRLDDAGEREALQARIQQVVEDFTGEPADEVVLAAPGAVLKTSSGKLRRAACRAAYDAGRLGRGERIALLGVLARGAWANLAQAARVAGAWLYAGHAWAVALSLFLPGVLLAALLPGLRLRWAGFRAMLRVLQYATATRLSIERASALPPSPCVLVSNHASYIDALVLVRALPRPVAFVAKHELAGHWLLGWLLRRAGAVFVAREDPVGRIEFVRHAATAGRDLLFFPEGTFAREAGLLPFRLGAFTVAAEAGLPVVPVALRGTRAMFRGDDRFPRRGAIAVTFGPALPAPAEGDAWSRALRLSRQARDFILARCGEPEAAGPPPATDAPA